ncbi:hypothetical protein CoNPh17_CDS0145 [Staphylococcus phage S-CoN_Ph17]|nr:hypothetical protein CoNPh17_CDS0145 [Staphylococcus phage S-CoN_Ph17]
MIIKLLRIFNDYYMCNIILGLEKGLKIIEKILWRKSIQIRS